MPPYCSSLQALLSSCIAKSSRVFSAPERRASSALHVFTFHSFNFRRFHCMAVRLNEGRSHFIPPKNARRGPNCGAKTPIPVPLRIWYVRSLRLTTAARTSIAPALGRTKRLRDTGVDLDVVRQVAGVGEAGSEPTAVDSVDAEREPLPSVDGAGRGGEGLVVIQEDIVSSDEIEFIGREIELPGLDLGALRDAVVEVLVQIQVFVSVRAGLFDAVDAAFGVVEGLKDKGGPELSLVDQVARPSCSTNLFRR